MHDADRRPRWARPPVSGLATLALVGVVLLAPGLAAARPSISTPAVVVVAASTDFLNVSATEAVAFSPNVLTVQPGDAVHLVVTQLADFNHTFTLSSVANITFPTTDTTADLDAFFATHPPLVNLSLGSTMGAKFYANFTAPPVGTYEFVCLESGHFAQGMHGELDSGTSPSSNSSSSYTLYLITAVVVVVLVVAIAALLMRRRHTPPT
jgi:plastocyanin